MTKKRDALKLVYRAVKDLIPYAGNARLHPDVQVSQIKASIVEFGFNNPILLDKDGVIVAGHGRLMAAKELKMDEVPTITLLHLTDAQRRAYLLADNKLALNGGWDMKVLQAEMARLTDDDGFDVNLIGFTEAELANITADPELDPGEEINDGGLGGSQKMQYLSFGGEQVPLSDDEMERLTKDLLGYQDARGTNFGYVTSLLDRLK